MRARAPTDPSTKTWPPPEPKVSDEERAERLTREREAKKKSDEIDAVLAEEKEKVREQRRATGARILLLGQAESGKSTVLKNFQLHFAPNAFRAEAILWRPIIHLNLLRSINIILEVVVRRLEDPSSLNDGRAPSDPSSTNYDGIRRLRYSLMPLKGVEELLARRIGVSPVSESTDPMESLIQTFPTPVSTVVGRRKTLFRWRRDVDNDPTATEKEKREDYSNRRIISACCDDMATLWENADVQRWLRAEGITLHDKPGFFLDCIRTISGEDYIPTSSDILRARIPTLGPEEHHIPVETSSALEELVGAENGREWIIYDVGGARTQRAAWAQFFDDVTAIIFMAPISAFSQSLEEDPSVNRLADSMKLWRSICSNKLLQDVHLVLFLNKTDLLELQLKNGVQFSKWVPSYKHKDRPNDLQSITNYLIEVFHGLHSQCSPKKRKVFSYLTCATDTEATSRVIARIQEAILVKSLSNTNIL